ncbi:hypothetical protein BJ508DRAFT_328301 [Ascobolus immersus RN42]|uniref:Mid2 domain-containing protein n=1 Tax=Ascobolus immersus RN42 TaxID=1160509 RepID=A0A3N4I5E9_ASCIM|nr:hypothetical protein BJ508DRAFT_328301 [Ascobolus immersus RN42]
MHSSLVPLILIALSSLNFHHAFAQSELEALFPPEDIILKNSQSSSFVWTYSEEDAKRNPDTARLRFSLLTPPDYFFEYETLNPDGTPVSYSEVILTNITSQKRWMRFVVPEGPWIREPGMRITNGTRYWLRVEEVENGETVGKLKSKRFRIEGRVMQDVVWDTVTTTKTTVVTTGGVTKTTTTTITASPPTPKPSAPVGEGTDDDGVLVGKPGPEPSIPPEVDPVKNTPDYYPAPDPSDDGSAQDPSGDGPEQKPPGNTPAQDPPSNRPSQGTKGPAPPPIVEKSTSSVSPPPQPRAKPDEESESQKPTPPQPPPTTPSKGGKDVPASVISPGQGSTSKPSSVDEKNTTEVTLSNTSAKTYIINPMPTPSPEDDPLPPPIQSESTGPRAPTPPSEPPSLETPSESSKQPGPGMSKGAKAGAIVGSIIFVAFVVIVVFAVMKRKRDRKQKREVVRTSSVMEHLQQYPVTVGVDDDSIRKLVHPAYRNDVVWSPGPPR